MERGKNKVSIHTCETSTKLMQLSSKYHRAAVSNIALIYCLVLILLGHKLETCCKQNKNFRQHDISVYPVDLYHSCSSHYIALTCAETHLGFNVF